MKPTDTPAEKRAVHPLLAPVHAWNRFWFTPADPTPLGLIRIFAGLFTFYVILAYTVDLQELFGLHAWVDAKTANEFRKDLPFVGRGFQWDETPRWEDPRSLSAAEQAYAEKYGANPRHLTARGMPVWSIWFHVTDPTTMAVVHGVILGIIFLFTIGFCSRLTSVLTWLAVMSYIQRAPTTLFGMDTMMNIVLLYLMIAPSGAALSVDRLIARYWASRRAFRLHREAASSFEPAPLISANLALRLMQVNLCFIYLMAGLAKLEGKAWWSGSATWGTMANPEFSPMHFPPFMGILKFLAQNRPLWEVCMTGGVLFTLFTEIGFAFLIWQRSLRWVYLSCAVVFHVGIAMFMGLNTFSLFMVTLLLAFVPVEAIHRLLNWLGRGAPHLRLLVNGRSSSQVKVASLVQAFDAWEQVEVGESPVKRNIPAVGPPIHNVGTLRPEAAGADRARLVDGSGEVLTGYYLFERLTRSLRLLWPAAALTWIPGVARLGKAWFPGEIQPALPALYGGNGETRTREAVAR